MSRKQKDEVQEKSEEKVEDEAVIGKPKKPKKPKKARGFKIPIN